MNISGLIFNGIHSVMMGKFLERLERTAPGIRHILAISSIDYQPSLSGVAQIEYLEFEKVVLGDYVETDADLPLDKDVLDRLGNDWLVLLKMLDRMPLEPFYGFETRVSALLRHIRFWNDKLRNGKYNCFIMFNYPHEVFDYVIYILCRSYGIRALFFTQIQIEGFVQLIEDIELNDPRLKNRSSKIGSRAEIELSAMMLNHWKKQTETFSPPFYMKANLAYIEKFNSKSARILEAFTLLKNGLNRVLQFNQYGLGRLVTRLHYINLFGRRANDRLNVFYESLCRELDADRPLIYVPLHYQPECTTSPQGGYFVFQQLMIRLLSFCSRGRFEIAIKEHPMQMVNGRSPGFYEELSRLPDVKLVPKNISSAELIRRCCAVATVTGTAGWEALFQNKIVLLFGNIFFQYAPGVIRVSTLEECQKGLDLIHSSGDLSGQRQALKEFLAGIEPCLVRGWVDPLYAPVSAIDEETNIENLFIALVDRLGAHSLHV